jgi:hypothetical protein
MVPQETTIIAKNRKGISLKGRFLMKERSSPLEVLEFLEQ